MAISITRKAAMIINRWPGCRERLCVRMRGCMAPHGDCGNARVIRLSPEEEQRRFVETVRLLQEQLARRLAAGEDIED
ncbi:MAG TPA: hypothetical protein VN655_16460 [Pseudolabrys sp.]|nr:hypothetical protein [Pseudolabrys sp.]